MNKSTHQDGPYDILLLAAGFLVLFLFGLRTISSPDIWLHLSAGRNALYNGPSTIDPFSFSLPAGTAWIQTSWLYDLLVYHLWRVGKAPLLILTHAAAVVGAFLLLLPVCRRYSGQVHQAIALLLAAWLLAPLFVLRPVVFCLLFMALQINLLSRPRINAAQGALLLVTQILWANMHSSFILGIGMVAIRIWEAYTRHKNQPPAETAGHPPPPHFIILGALLVIVSMINPVTYHAFGEAAGMMVQPDGGITLEWISLFQGNFLPLPTGYVSTLALVLIAAVFIFYKGRLPAIPTFCAIISAFLLVRSKLNSDVCALLAFPFLAMSLGVLSTFISRLPSKAARNRVSRSAYTVTALLLVISAWTVMTNRYYIASGSASGFGLRVNSDAFPVGALAFIGPERPLPDRTLNIAHDGGFMIWRRPNDRIFTDPRGDVYGGLFFQRLAKGILGNERHWKDLIMRYDPEGILLNASWTGAGTAVYQLMNRGDWIISYFDGTTVLLVRKTASNRTFIEDEELQKKGLRLIDESYARYQRHLNNRVIRAPNPSRLIGAATVLQALGRHEESYKVWCALTQGTPRMISAWVNRGIAEMKLDKTKEAITSLEYALDKHPANSIALLWLSEAYKAENRQSDAAGIFDQARRINPEMVELFMKERESSMFQAPRE